MSENLQEEIRLRYGNVASSSLSNDHAGVRAVAEAFGYSADELASLPAEANMGLSCGNPTAMASLKPGDVVVDLGCGGGLDVFLAAQKIGPGGKAIGIDMTPSMIDRARKNARTGPGGKPYTNVEFHLATIDNLPIADSSVDVVVSNCVINLAADKIAVFREIARVLRPGGRLVVSDIALKKPLPDQIAKDVMAYVGCIAGAIAITEYESGLRSAGFEHIQIVDSAADLNAYSKVEGQSACCPPVMSKPVALPVSSCCGAKVETAVGSCCSTQSTEPAEPCCDKEPSALETGCCTAVKEKTSELHAGLSDLLIRYDVNEFAASVKVSATKPG
jgi:SAM-dependent methyltransferase